MKIGIFIIPNKLVYGFLIAGSFFGMLCALAYFVAMFNGPHMIEQPHILAYQRRMPFPPPGAVPVEPNDRKPPGPEEAKGMRNPLAATKENLEFGKTYYDYYCVFCHGENGEGNGPVGYSYMPRPKNLHDPEVLKKPDGQLLLAILTGIGHEPVLARVIPPRHRWYLVLYTRALGQSPVPPEFRNESGGRVD